MLELPPIDNKGSENSSYSQEELQALTKQAEDKNEKYKEMCYILTLEDAAEKIEKIYNTLDEAEAVFEAEGRESTKPFLNEIYKELGELNDSVTEINPLAEWNSNGYLTKTQFNELNLRRKKLSNAVGIMTSSGVIRHDLNEL